MNLGLGAGGWRLAGEKENRMRITVEKEWVFPLHSRDRHISCTWHWSKNNHGVMIIILSLFVAYPTGIVDKKGLQQVYQCYVPLHLKRGDTPISIIFKLFCVLLANVLFVSPCPSVRSTASKHCASASHERERSMWPTEIWKDHSHLQTYLWQLCNWPDRGLDSLIFPLCPLLPTSFSPPLLLES